MATLKEKFAGNTDYLIMLCYDVWKESGKPDRTQVRTPYLPIEEIVEKYGDFEYHMWYSDGFKDGRKTATVWAFAPAEKRVDPWLYEHWPELWGRA